MNPSSSDRIKHLGRWGSALLGGAVAIFVGILYFGTLAPTVLPYGVPDTLDSPMLQAEVSVLGIGHPTGYPTYMMLTHLFTYLPFGDPAYRINLASAVYGVAAVLVVYLAGLRLCNRAVAAAAGALAFGFVAGRRVFSRQGLMLKGLGLFLAGLLPLLYLPVRALMHAPLNEADPSTPWRFLLLVTGGSFLAESSEKGRHCSPSSLTLADTATKLGLFGDHLLGQVPLVLMLAGVLAAVYLLFADRATAMLLGTLFLGCLVQAAVYLLLAIEDFYVFLIPAILTFGLCISAGLGALLRLVENLTIGSTARGALLVILSALMLLVPLLGVPDSYAAHDRSEDHGGRRMIGAVVSDVEKGATVLHHGSPLWYMVLMEGRRRDLTLMDPFCTSWDRHTDVVCPDQISAAEAADRYGTDDATGVEAARRAAGSGPVYLLANGRARLDSFREAGFDVLPGESDRFLYKLVPRGRG